MKQQRQVGEALGAGKRRTKRWLLLLGGLAVAVFWRLRQRASSGSGPAEPPGRSGSTVLPAPGAEAPKVVASKVETSEVEGLSPAEAARILGCTAEELPQLLSDGAATTREAVEEIALQHYRWRRHVDDPDSYWVTLKQASSILGVSSQQLKRQLDEGHVPFVVHRDGVRLMRREQLDSAAGGTEKE